MKKSELRKKYLSSKISDLTAYAGMIGDEFSSKLNRLSQIIGINHELSVGEYKESLLKSCLKNFLPKRYSVGTGFIIFVEDSPMRNLYPDNTDISHLKSHSTSHQLDVIVYDDNDFAPLFRDGDFVILRPESVRSIIEVKGFLDGSNTKSCIKKFSRLSRKWHTYSKRYDEYNKLFENNLKLHEPGLFLMGWDVRINKNGRKMCSGKTLRRAIVDTYRCELAEKEITNKEIPLLKAAYIYDDCVVTAMGYSSDNTGGFGYSTMRGKFVRYDADGKPYLDRDCTIWNLLSSIYINLESPFNPDFVYFDQSSLLSVLPHKDFGTTDLKTGKEVKNMA